MDTTVLTTSDEALDTLQSILNALERLVSQTPQMSRVKEVKVSMDGFGGAFATSVINATSNPITGNLLYRTNEPFNFGNMGANHLYRNIN